MLSGLKIMDTKRLYMLYSIVVGMQVICFIFIAGMIFDIGSISN